MKIPAEEYRKKYIKEAGKKVLPPPPTKPKRVERENEPDEIPDADGSGAIEPLVWKVFASVIIRRAIRNLGIADVHYHPDHIVIHIQNRTFQIKITEI